MLQHVIARIPFGNELRGALKVVLGNFQPDPCQRFSHEPQMFHGAFMDDFRLDPSRFQPFLQRFSRLPFIEGGHGNLIHIQQYARAAQNQQGRDRRLRASWEQEFVEEAETLNRRARRSRRDFCFAREQEIAEVAERFLLSAFRFLLCL